MSPTLILLFCVCAIAGQELQSITNPIEHGEGPHWSTEEQSLYWVDITKRDIWKLHPESGNITTCHIEEDDVTVIVPIKNEKCNFAVGVGDKLKLLTWNGRNESKPILSDIASFAPISKGARLNDGKVDNKGRLWIGTIGHEENNIVDPNKGALYKIGCTDKKIAAILQESNITVSNGIAWSADGYIMYYIDSPTRNIDAFDFDPQNGTLCNRRTIFKLDGHNVTGVPDGMTIDADDNLWIALFGGSAIMEIQPHLGRLLKVYNIPNVPQVTSVAWGGPRLDILYITTSSRGGVPGGQLYQLAKTGARGYPANEFQIPKC